MSVMSRYQACRILGISVSADTRQIKAAYKSLCKLYHPDVQSDPLLAQRYYEVTEAYEYLTGSGDSAGGRVLGEEIGSGFRARQRSREEYDRWQKQEKQRKQEKIRAFERRAEECRREREYREAMDAIHAIRAAEIIRRIIGEDTKK